MAPDGLTQALDNSAVDIEVRMMVEVSDSIAVGGEILAPCVHESEYLDHDVLSKTAALDQSPYNSFTYFIL